MIVALSRPQQTCQRFKCEILAQLSILFVCCKSLPAAARHQDHDVGGSGSHDDRDRALPDDGSQGPPGSSNSNTNTTIDNNDNNKDNDHIIMKILLIIILMIIMISVIIMVIMIMT